MASQSIHVAEDQIQSQGEGHWECDIDLNLDDIDENSSKNIVMTNLSERIETQNL